MPDNKLTDNEIIKALMICSTKGASCKDCSAFVKVDRSNCKKVLLGALDLINRLQAENENYSKNNQTMTSDILKLYKELEQAKAENERLKKDSKDIDEFARNICKERLLQGKAIADFDSLQRYIKQQKAEAYKEVLGIIDQVYNKHIFDSNDFTDEEKDAIINFSDDITNKLIEILKKD